MKSEKQITDSVFQALLWDARVSPARIDVRTDNCQVTLSGTVDNFHKKWSAIDNAMKVPNVLEVIDKIRVVPTDVVDDSVLQQNIEKALSNDSRLAKESITSFVKNGSVALRGEVQNYYQKIAAEESSRWVKGVVNVINQIEVLPRNSDYDHQIRRRVEDLISQNIRINTNDVKVKVENGIVLLSGRINNIMNKVYVESLASMVANVSYVQNELVISKSS